MLTRETHRSKDDNMNQETGVKSDIKYHKRHSRTHSVSRVDALRHHHEHPKAGSVSFAYSMKSQK